MRKLREDARAGNATGAPSMTITVSPTTPVVHVHLPAPSYVWTDSDDATITVACGMTRSAFAATVREMLADADHGGRVISISQKRRGVAVDDLIAFLRSRYCAVPQRRDPEPANDAPEAAPRDGVDEVLALVGGERVPERATRRGR
jgi:hypothetical protein